MEIKKFLLLVCLCSVFVFAGCNEEETPAGDSLTPTNASKAMAILTAYGLLSQFGIDVDELTTPLDCDTGSASSTSDLNSDDEGKITLTFNNCAKTVYICDTTQTVTVNGTIYADGSESSGKILGALTISGEVLETLNVNIEGNDNPTAVTCNFNAETSNWEDFTGILCGNDPYALHFSSSSADTYCADVIH